MEKSFALLFLALSLTACDSDSDESPTPHWTPDADIPDAASSDAASSDADSSDAASSDADSSDAASSDADISDADSSHSSGPDCSDICNEIADNCDCAASNLNSTCNDECGSTVAVKALEKADCEGAIELLDMTIACTPSSVSCFDVCEEIAVNCTCADSSLYSMCNLSCGTRVTADALNEADCDGAIALLSMTISCGPSSNRGSGKACNANGTSGYCMSTDWCAEYPDTKSVSGTCTDEASNVQCCVDRFGDYFPCKTANGYCFDANDGEEKTSCVEDGGKLTPDQCPGSDICCEFTD